MEDESALPFPQIKHVGVFADVLAIAMDGTARGGYCNPSILFVCWLAV